jgi:hypothetical protein
MGLGMGMGMGMGMGLGWDWDWKFCEFYALIKTQVPPKRIMNLIYELNKA